MATILITGGSGLIGKGLVQALLLGDETVRILSRGAEREVDRLPEGRAEAFAADIGDASSLKGAAAGCDCVVHIAGIAQESDDLTFESVNVEGTRALLQEATRAGKPPFIYISSLGAERGKSDYHRSKWRAEELVREYEGDWLILRPGNVYGPGDTVISELLTMVRTLPAVPTINSGDQPFQPVWYEDLANAIARAIRRNGPWHRTLELAGTERVTTNDVLDRLCRLTGRDPVRVPVPDAVASLAAKVGEVTGIDLPIDENRITMLLEENVIGPSSSNALVGVFEIQPLKLDEGLRLLVDRLPERTPAQGAGALERKHFRVEIVGSGLTPAQMMDRFRQNAAQLMDVELGSEPGTSTRIETGATLTGRIPVRGNFQVRVEESQSDRVTMVTLQGHPLAGVVRFRTEQTGAGVAFNIEIYSRGGSFADHVAMELIGSMFQDSNWIHVCERMVELSRGTAPGGVEATSSILDDDDAAAIEEWVDALVAAREKAGYQPRERPQAS